MWIGSAPIALRGLRRRWNSGIERETPLAAAGGVCYLRVAADAFAGEAVVDGLGEARVFDSSDGPAGMEGHALALTGGLNAAAVLTDRASIVLDIDNRCMI